MVRVSANQEGKRVEIGADDFEQAVRSVQPSVTPQMIQRLEAWASAKGTPTSEDASVELAA